MADTPVEYPPVSFHFRVEFMFSNGDGKSEVRFQEVSGLGKEMTTEELVEGGENRFVHRFPRGARYSNLVLKRGMKPDSKIIDWVRNGIDNFDFSPVNVIVTLLNPDHNPLVTWSFQNCWPLRWSTADLRAQESSVLIESLELNYQYYEQKAS